MPDLSSIMCSISDFGWLILVLFCMIHMVICLAVASLRRHKLVEVHAGNTPDISHTISYKLAICEDMHFRGIIYHWCVCNKAPDGWNKRADHVCCCALSLKWVDP